MLSNNEKYIFTSELALAISNGLQVEDGLKMLVGFDADVSMCAKKLEDIMKQGYSFTDALKESKEFVINLTTKDLVYKVDWCGVKTGAKVDKFKEMNLTKEKAKNVKCPIIKESPVAIECRVKEIKKLGSHDMFVAEVLSIDADDKYIDDKGTFDISKCDLITYANGKYFSLGKQVGKFGYSVQKKKRKK